MNRLDPSPLHADKVDQALSGFFKQQMPQPWPAFAYPDSRSAVRPASNWNRHQRWMSRLALAACVALLFVGYYTLSNIFPGAVSRSGGLMQDTSGHIGMGLRHRSTTPRPFVTPVTRTPNEDGDFEGSGRPMKIK